MNHISSNNKELESNPKSYNHTNRVDNYIESKIGVEGVPLTTHDAVKYLLQGTLRLRVCRYCLNVTKKLSELDEVLTLAVNNLLHEVTLRDIVASFYPFKVAGDPNFPNKICSECVNRAINCYLFTQQCERAERALRNCFEDIYETFDKLDPLVPVKKRGKRKLNPNHNIIYTEHKDVINYAEPIINIINVTSDSTQQNNGEINNLECQKCWQVLPNVESLLNHEKSHPKNMWYNCKLCGKSFVKRTYLKRHIKGTHEYENDNSEKTPDQFECKECGIFSKTLGEHLQHCEKHKFKGLFKCLIERKVDMLCSVCLDKGSRLMDLGEVVHLHGGYSGLTGDKNIRNILTATIPGPNLHKYQELLVPHKAKILKITKRKFESKKKNSFLSQELKNQCLKLKFAFPILVAKMESELANSVMLPKYKFCFSQPYLINPIQDLIKQDFTKCTSIEDKTVLNDYNTTHCSLKKSCTEKKEIRENLQLTKSITDKISETYLSDQIQCFNNQKFPECPMNKGTTLAHDNDVGNLSSKHVEQEQIGNIKFRSKDLDINKVIANKDQRVAKSTVCKSIIHNNVSIEAYDPEQLINIEKSSKLTTSNIFSFSNPILLDIHEVTSETQDSAYSSLKNVTLNNKKKLTAINSESILETVNSCKTCWIFKAPCCSCLDPINNSVNILNKAVINNGNCKFCWIFDKTGNCSFCKHTSDRCEQVLENTEEVSKIDTGVNEVKFPKKKSVNDANEQKTTWQCNICLAKNSNNIISCICCDEKNDRNKNAKFNYGNFTFYTGINKVKERPNGNNVVDKSDKNIAECDETTTDTRIDSNQSQLNIEDEPMEIVHNSAPSHKATPLIDIDRCINNVLHMDVEITPFDNKIPDTSNIENMDLIFEDNDQTNAKTISLSDQYPINNSLSDIENFQNFNLNFGVNDIKHTTDRRFKKAKRRIATSRK